MSRKIFVSYKYKDSLVYPITANSICRNYVDVIMERLEDVHIYKGEEDGNDLSKFKDDTIWTNLKAKIRDSSVTLVLISKGMKTNDPEEDQWIPQEVSYSLRETTFDGRTSLPNGVLGVVIPDENGRYDYFFENNNCVYCDTIRHKTENLFEILKNNMFNRKQPILSPCHNPSHITNFHLGDNHSYIYQVKWDNFITSPTPFIELAIALRDKIEEFNVQKEVITA